VTAACAAASFVEAFAAAAAEAVSVTVRYYKKPLVYKYLQNFTKIFTIHLLRA
jgi:methyl coenzyme M reductase beta subunit